MTLPHWEDIPEYWDRLQIGDWVMPGVWTVDFSLRREIDVKKAASTDGASLKDKGYHPPLLTLRGKLVERSDWARLQEIMPALHPKRKGGKREPYRIVHPKTLLVGITSIYIHEIDAISLDNGVLTLELRAYELDKPKPTPREVTVAVGVKPLEPPPSIARYPGMEGVISTPRNHVLYRTADFSLAHEPPVVLPP